MIQGVQSVGIEHLPPSTWIADAGLGACHQPEAEAALLSPAAQPISRILNTGYENLKPYLTSLHLKDTRTIDGPSCKFEWCELGTGDPDYAALFRTFARDRHDVLIAVAAHYAPPGGTPADGVGINHRKALELAKAAQ